MFALGKDEISVLGVNREKILSQGKYILELFYLAKTHKLRISDETLEMIHHGMEFLPESFFNTSDVAHLFILILSEPGGIAKTLRLMHQVSLLEKVIPEFSRVNRLVQFNQYHKFTVDEHSFNAVEHAENLTKVGENLNNIYSEIKRKDILHLGILLHDMGKGLGGDHSEKGAEIASSVAFRLNFDKRDRDLLVFLVRFHLLMTHIAFRRDLSDEKVLVNFARKVAKPEVLKKLYVLTCSDIKAVGPGTWNGWKENLLADLFYKTLEALAGTESTLSNKQRIQKIWEEALQRVGSDYPQDWLEEQRKDMSERYLLVTPVEKIIKDLYRIRQLEPGGIVVDVEDRDPSGVVDLSVYTFDNIIPGLFSKISGVLAAKGLQILGAQAHTRKKGIVVDTFQVVDPDYTGKTPQERWNEIEETLKGVLQKKIEVEKLFGKRFSGGENKQVGALLEPTLVEVDNDSSDDYTIIEVFAADRRGLLYVITKTIFELGLSVFSSKIATRLDQIVDVFYVKDEEGKKVVDENKISDLKEKIIKAIEI
jgi:[protein-PII] uridylyltransferase